MATGADRMSEAVARDPVSGVRLLGDVVSYADGAEDEVLAVLAHAADRSSASDELAERVVDWPTRYHFSRLRANLLRPFAIGPGHRVLDVGAGSGALARYLGERGAHVLALEGTLPRARAAAARCRGLAGVEVACGALSALNDSAGFDLVVCVGVYEHVARGGSEQAAAFLASLRALARPEGAVLLAIENQLGLKYLLGYGEDHAGEPWLGVEGYPGPPAARTFSRAGLRTNLAHSGFPSQRFFYPFPDYKLPTVILDESAYDGSDAVDFVDQLVRWPCTADASAPSRLTDDRRSHRVFLEAGLGAEVANSFLVLAARSDSVRDRFRADNVRAWHFGSDRQRRWLGVKAVKTGARLRLESTPLQEGPSPEQGWLRQAREADVPFVVGRTIEQDALDACAAGRDDLARVLREWRDNLRALETPVGKAAPSPAHPFLGPLTRCVLPAEYLDVSLSNFVRDREGRIHYVDAEWRAPGPVDADLVVVRAIWSFATDLVHRGVLHPGPSAATVDETSAWLAALCESPADGALLERFRVAESELQARIHGVRAEDTKGELETVGRRSRLTFSISRDLPFTALRRDARALPQREAELRALRESTSWKVTAPLRALGRAITRLRSGGA